MEVSIYVTEVTSFDHVHGESHCRKIESIDSLQKTTSTGCIYSSVLEKNIHLNPMQPHLIITPNTRKETWPQES